MEYWWALAASNLMHKHMYLDLIPDGTIDTAVHQLMSNVHEKKHL